VADEALLAQDDLAGLTYSTSLVFLDEVLYILEGVHIRILGVQALVGEYSREEGQILEGDDEQVDLAEFGAEVHLRQRQVEQEVEEENFSD